MPRLDTFTRNIVSGHLLAGELQNADLIMFSGARFPDSCNCTSNPIQQLTAIVLADLGSHQQPKITTSGYFIWETGPWRQEKQHQISEVSDEYRHRQSETLSVKAAYAPDVLTLAQYWDIARFRWCNRVRGLNLKRWRQVRFSDESRFMQQKRDDRTCVYRRRNEIFARNSVLEVDNFGGGSLMMWGAISSAQKTQMVPISGNLSAMRYRYEVLTPHMLPQWTSVGTLFSTQLVLLLTF
jgi:hypothetical protein